MARLGMFPKVSIAMPVYNGGEYFELALKSALAQTYDNIEIVVVDDGSTDEGKTADLGRRYAAEYPDKVRFFHQENSGVAGALNRAIAEMSGEIFCWLSHDDIFHPEKTERQVQFFGEIERGNAFLFSDYSLIDSSGEKITDVHLRSELFRLGPRASVYRGGVSGCTVFIPVEFLRIKKEPFDLRYRYAQDYWCWLELLKDGAFFHQPEIFVDYRIHPGQDTHKPEATREGEHLWRTMIDTASALEKVQMYGSEWKFLQETYNIMNRSPYKDCALHLKERADLVLKNTVVSVVIPFFNEIGVLRRAVASVTGQTHQKLEIILIDDGSTEDVEPIHEMAREDRRIKIITQKNSGPAAARNVGIQATSGEYIAFLDADDVFVPHKIEYQLRLMSEAGKLVSHTSYFVSFPERTGRIGVIGTENFSGNVYPLIVGGCPVAMPTLMIHRSVILDGLKFSEKHRMSEDQIFLADLALRHDFLGLPHALTVVEWSENTAALNIHKLIEGFTNVIDAFSKHPFHRKAKSEIDHISSVRATYLKMADAGGSELLGVFEYAFGPEGNPKCPELSYHPAVADAQQGNLTRAIDSLRAYLRYAPPAPPQQYWSEHYWLACCLASLGEFSEADALFATDIHIPLGEPGEYASTLIVRCGPMSPRQCQNIHFSSGELVDGPLYVVGADDLYFRRFGREALTAALASDVGFVLHVHLVNPEEDTLLALKDAAADIPGRLSWSWINSDLHDATDSGRRAFYSAARFLAAPEILRRYRRPMLMCDIDQLIVGDVRPVIDDMADADIGLMVFPTQRANILSLVSASVFFAGHTPEAEAFLEDVADYLAAVCDPASDGMWHVDQAALATRMLRRTDTRIAKIPARLMQSTFSVGETPEAIGPETVFWSVTASISANASKLNHPIFRRFGDGPLHRLEQLRTASSGKPLSATNFATKHIDGCNDG